MLNEPDKNFLIGIINISPKISAEKLSFILIEKTNKKASNKKIQRELKFDRYISAQPRILPLLSIKNTNIRLKQLLSGLRGL